jgi:hypothetical protein
MGRTALRIGGAMICLPLLLMAGCSSTDKDSAREQTTPKTTPTSTPTSPSPAASALVGEWQRLQKCSELEQVMTKAGLHDVLLEFIAGDGWIPDVTKVSQIKDPTHPCVGSVDRTHSHFFTADGQFGSRDANGQQVDDGQYQVVGDAFVIDSVTFHYTITDSDTLSITPETPGCAPSCFEAGWSISVAFPGYTWHRIG